MDRVRYLEGIRRAEHEIEVWKRRFMELETRFLRLKQVEFQKFELERAFEVGIAKYDGLALEFGKKKKECVEIQAELDTLILRKIAVEVELKEHKKMCIELKERITRLEEDQKVICERENRDLECGKRKAVGEIEVRKKRFRELETQAALRLKHEVELEKELEVHRTKCHGLSVELEKEKMACVVVEDNLKDLMIGKVAVDDELKEYKKMCNGQKKRITLLEKDQNILRGREKRAMERITYLLKELKKRESDESVKCVQLKTENKNLECGKRNAENKIEVWKKRFRELETQALRLKQVELEKGELEKELEAYKAQCHGLSVELEEKKMECVAIEGKLKDLRLRKITVDDELKEYKTTCNETKEMIMGLEEDQKVICKKEKRAQERITYLEEEIKKIESDEREKYVQLKTENRDLECGKRRAEDEIEIWKKRFRELETQFLRLEEENSTLRCIDSHVSENIELEAGGLQTEVPYNDKQKTYRNKKLQSETDGAHLPHLKIKEKMFNSSAFAGCNHPSSPQGNRNVHIAGPPSINMKSEPLVNAMEEKKNTPLESKVDFGSRVRKQIGFELKRSSSEKLALREKGSVRPAFGGIVEISDNEDEKEIVPKHTCNIIGKQTVHVSTDDTLKRSSDNEKNLTSKKCSKRPCSDRRGEEYGSSCEEDIPLSSTPKRRRALKTVTTDSESEDDDRIPIGKLKMKKLEELNEGVHKLSPLSLHAEKVTRSSGGENVEKSISPSSRRLISLRQCEKNKNWVERTFSNVSTSANYLQMSGNSYQKAANATSENGKEDLVEGIGSHSEGKSLGGVIENWSDSSDSGDSSSDSEDARDFDLAFNQVIEMVKRNRLKESKWQFEADMLSSFEEDPELCMKAVCTLYRQQISEKKLMEGSLHFNNRGFNKYDALRFNVNRNALPAVLAINTEVVKSSFEMARPVGY
ncbi:hypothetical protein BVC80_8981g29 [Macleaya cordata]|uniref:Uncharacterized protein n=1 Tax=Macleaya cordata TaxID=56857 RepID=A0A200Q7C2_MACCD|nr:hypothetical protein BVC80_8981g29 [Macleaya cordata]